MKTLKTLGSRLKTAFVGEPVDRERIEAPSDPDARRIVALLSAGSVSLQRKRYVTKEQIDDRRKAVFKS